MGEFRFVFFCVSPGDRSSPPDGLDIVTALAEMDEKLPGLTEYLEPGAPGMHAMASIDYGIAPSGSVTMELDDGATVTLHAGDTYIQNGTRHRWTNDGEVTALLACTLIGVPHGRVV